MTYLQYLDDMDAFIYPCSELIKDYKLRQKLSRKCRELVDGHGALRIANF